MIFKSFLFSSLSFSMRIINSVVVVGLYYGFLTTFSIGPSKKEIFATTGDFIMGQLMIFISIYYPPLYLFFLS
ncbi:hypothetical chloroplast RF19 (chloroplast) [Aegilops tauschii]|uniref:Protein TIC 214 n=1 Tax=Aegilops tauschii TaxID=37682 RepID=S4S832_AEGTA|nr:hypothetical chloroplast RF19 [Aegilops tauschii]AFH89557.1 hypothetical chloroplast RF19 [Aegilops tauschii]